jgi:hypothetical protein
MVLILEALRVGCWMFRGGSTVAYRSGILHKAEPNPGVDKADLGACGMGNENEARGRRV